jgi:hypothetical protein
MQSSVTLSLAAVAVCFGIVSTPAAAVEISDNAKNTASGNGLLPAQGSSGSGFSVIERHNNSLKESPLTRSDIRSDSADGLARPAGRWRDGLTALASTVSGEAELSTNMAGQEGVLTPNGKQPNQQGFSAIKAAAGLRPETDQAVEDLRSGAVASVPSGVLSPRSK